MVNPTHTSDNLRGPGRQRVGRRPRRHDPRSRSAASCYESAVDNIVAHAGGGQANATPLTALMNRVTTVATAADSVALPPRSPAWADHRHQRQLPTPCRSSASRPTPSTASPPAPGVSLAAGKTANYCCYTAGAWHQLVQRLTTAIERRITWLPTKCSRPKRGARTGEVHPVLFHEGKTYEIDDNLAGEFELARRGSRSRTTPRFPKPLAVNEEGRNDLHENWLDTDPAVLRHGELTAQEVVARDESPNPQTVNPAVQVEGKAEGGMDTPSAQPTDSVDADPVIDADAVLTDATDKPKKSK